MAMWGWSAGDILLLAKLAYESYQFFRNVPDDLRETSNRLKYVGDELRDLSDVLKASGWTEYDRAPELQQLRKDLIEAKSFFERYQSLYNSTQSPGRRLITTARLAIKDQNELRKIEKGLTGHLEKITAVRQKVILVCSFKNLELVKKLHDQGELSSSQNEPIDESSRNQTSLAQGQTLGKSRSSFSLNDDSISIISGAASAIKLASRLKRSIGPNRPFQSRLEPIPSTSPVLDALAASPQREVIDKFIDDMVSLSTELQLFSKTTSKSQDQRPEDLAKLVSTATNLCNTLLPGYRRAEQQISLLTLPVDLGSPIESFIDSVFSNPTIGTDHTSFTRSTTCDRATGTLALQIANKEDSRPNDDPILQNERLSSMSNTDDEISLESISISEAGSYIMSLPSPAKEPLLLNRSVMIFEPKIIGSLPIRCVLDFTEARGNTSHCFVTAVALDQRRPSVQSSRARPFPSALTPRVHLDMDENKNDSNPAANEQRRVFHHNFNFHARPLPHVLHPDVEGPKMQPDEPFTVRFTVPQHFVEEEGTEAPSMTTELKYIFTDREDRDLLQEKIFGKLLLKTVGIDRFVMSRSSFKTDLECSQQALRLWKIEAGGSKTITVYYKHKRTNQKTYREYIVLGTQLPGRSLRSGEPVDFSVAEIMPDEIIPLPSSPASIRSFPSSRSSGSIMASPPRTLTCSVYFSTDRDRTQILQLIR